MIATWLEWRIIRCVETAFDCDLSSLQTAIDRPFLISLLYVQRWQGSTPHHRHPGMNLDTLQGMPVNDHMSQC